MTDSRRVMAIGTVLWCALSTALPVSAQGTAPPIRIERLLDRPIITPQLQGSIGQGSIGPNIQGPSLIRVYSHDAFTEATTPHIASPDVHVDDANRRISMYYHGLNGLGQQVTRAATSADGIRFGARPEILGKTYFRTFQHAGYTYAMAMPGQFYRSKDPLSGFEEGPLLFNPNMRHAALLKRGDTLFVFWTQVGSAPEAILLSTIALSGDWKTWSASRPIEVLRPERAWEGANAPLTPSLRSTAYRAVNQLRDPAVFEENGRTFLLFAVAGESGIAIAEVKFEP